MANGTTLTILTNHAKDYRESITSSDAGAPAEGSPTFLYDDDECQEDLVLALQKAIMWVTANVHKRKAV